MRNKERSQNRSPLSLFRRAIKLYLEDRNRDALALVEAALGLQPGHFQSLILGGDICLFRAESLGLSEAAGDARAIDFYRRAIGVEPNDATAWSGLSLALLYTGHPAEALDAAERGLAVAPLRVGYRMRNASTYENVVAGLCDRKVRALLELGQRESARTALLDGLTLYPGNSFLMRLFRCFGSR